MNKKNSTIYLVQAAFIAAVYIALTYFLKPISFSGSQLRVAEALTILPVLTPAAVPGLTIGCIISNLSSPYGVVDIICGSAATLLAAICSRATRNVTVKGVPVLSAVFPVIFNAVIIGAEISALNTGGFTWPVFGAMAVSVGFGQLLACFVLGLPLCAALKKTKVFDK